MLHRFLVGAAVVGLGATAPAAEWSWQWGTAEGQAAPQVEICRFQYGKEWAYAIEIDDGPMCMMNVVQPLLAKYEFTDAPAGVAGGKAKPFVAGAAVIGVGTGVENDTVLQWEDLRKLKAQGWGVINHGYYHKGHGWAPEEKLTTEQYRQDLYWSQTLLAVEVGNGRAPTHFVYPNGYLAYRPHLAEFGLRSGTHVAGDAANWAVYGEKVDLYNLQRSYLDAGVWLGDWGKKDPLFWFPKDGPGTDSIHIDFTHGIDVEGTPNYGLWVERLGSIASRFGKAGKDNLWCAPTGQILNYVTACRQAKVRAEGGRVSVQLPDTIPGSPLTLKLTGIRESTPLIAPAGATLYRKGETVWLTTPMIGLPDAPPPKPLVKRIYVGAVKDMAWEKPIVLAGVRLLQGSPLAKDFQLKLDFVTPEGEVRSLLKPDEVKLPETWGRWWLYGPVPNGPAVRARELRISHDKPLQKMEVWVAEE